MLGALVVGWLVTAATADRILARSAPATALFWNPSSADAHAQAGARLLLDQAGGKAMEQVRDHAARSLARQPVNPVAARLLGFVAAQNGRLTEAERLVGFAERMSRRDLPTQLWLIESNVQRGDIPAVLLHYDRALRTNRRARNTLFPVLGAAADEPAVRAPLARFLAHRPQWWRPFMDSYVPKAQSSASLFAFARALRMDRPPSFDPWMLQAIEKRLVELTAYASSAALYNAAHGLPPGDRTPLRNGNFEQPGSWDPFDWNLVDEENLSAVRQANPVRDRGNALFLLASNGRGGDLAAQLTLLAPGRYVLAAEVGGVSGDPLAYPQLIVRCARDGREILRQSFPPASETGRPWRLAFAVPTGCDAQRVVLRAASALDQSTASPWIDTVAIRPLESR